MNRRTLLGRLAAGAAAVLGCGMVAPKAEAAEIDSAPIFGPDMQWTGYVIRADYELRVSDYSASAERAVVYGTDPGVFHLRAGTFSAAEVNSWMAATGATEVHGAGMAKTFIYGPEVMSVTGMQGVTRVSNEAAIADLEVDAYERGRAVAEARVESRLAEGLPIKRGAVRFSDLVDRSYEREILNP